MDKVKEKLLFDFMKSNKTRRQKQAEKFGFKTADEYKAYLQSESITEDAVKPAESGTDIVLAFDTTGSMNSYIGDVKKHLVELIPTLFKETTNLRIGVVAFGDYCDMKSPTEFGKAYQVLNLTNNEEDIINFVRSAQSTGGGDSDEFYELVIKKIVEESGWRINSNKSVLFIADCAPHRVGYSYYEMVKNNQIDWRQEAEKAKLAGIKFDTLSILGYKWYQELSEITGGIHMLFQSSHKTSDLITGYSYARSGSTESFAMVSKTVMASGDEELIGVYKTLSTI